MTSSVLNEGKSSVSSLSRTLAESGKKILMVDADFKKISNGSQISYTGN